MLLAAGAGVDKTNLSGSTPLMMAAQYGFSKTAEVRLSVESCVKYSSIPIIALFRYSIISSFYALDQQLFYFVCEGATGCWC